MALPVLTPEEIILQLDSGSMWDGSTITYRVAQTTQGVTAFYSETDGFKPVSPYVAHYFKLTMGLWDDLISANFVQTTAADSDVELAFSDVGVEYAHAYFPEHGGTIWLNSDKVDPGFSVGTYSFDTMVHEAGHALGLDHMGNYNGSATIPLPSSFQDSEVFSIMSYFGPEGSSPTTSDDVQQADWVGADDKSYSPQTPMLSDVLAIQSIYGVSTTTRTGNTTYGFNYNSQLGRAEVFDFSMNLHPILTIFDSAGNDTLDLSGWRTPSTIFLEAGKFSSCNAMTNNLSIAYGCVIENAVGGSGSDAITGNGVANRLSGLAGADRLDGLGGADVLSGGAGNDTLTGGTGIDTLIGGAGDDVYFVDHESDVVAEMSWAPGETDSVYASVSYRLAPAFAVENLQLMGRNALKGTGNAQDNTLVGNIGANVLSGGAGADTLDGGAGTDTLIGGTGNDTYVVGQAGDVIQESSTASGEIDTVISFLDFTLGATLENLELQGFTDLNGTGNAADNRLKGNAGDNVLKGGAGADSLDGGEGADTLIGGTGNDTYAVRDAGDVVQESSTLASEIDTVRAYIDFTLGATLENLLLRGTDDLNGTGNAAANRLTGNAGDNVLKGGAGTDTLDGGAGADTLIGGTGNDTYVVREADDVVKESSMLVTEIDTVVSYLDYTLGATLENLRLRGDDDLNGTGNAANNRLTGNAGENVLDGGAGNDTLIGGGSINTLIGGAGNDLYILEWFGDVVTEAANAGIDTVRSNVGYALTDHVENLELTGEWAFKGIGNAGNNRITGHVQSNALEGGAGNDTLIGAGGADSLTGGSGNDRFSFTAWDDLGLGTLRDVITDFTVGQDKIDLSRIDANAALAGDQAFALVATGFGSQAGQVYYRAGVVSINTDTDAQAEFQIQLTGTLPTALSASDFML